MSTDLDYLYNIEHDYSDSYIKLENTGLAKGKGGYMPSFALNRMNLGYEIMYNYEYEKIKQLMGLKKVKERKPELYEFFTTPGKGIIAALEKYYDSTASHIETLKETSKRYIDRDERIGEIANINCIYKSNYLQLEDRFFGNKRQGIYVNTRTTSLYVQMDTLLTREYQRGSGCYDYEIILTKVYKKEFEKYYKLCLLLGKEPDNAIFEYWIDEELDTPRSRWASVRGQYRKKIKPRIEASGIPIIEKRNIRKELYTYIEPPKFKVISEFPKWLVESTRKFIQNERAKDNIITF